MNGQTIYVSSLLDNTLNITWDYLVYFTINNYTIIYSQRAPCVLGKYA